MLVIESVTRDISVAKAICPSMTFFIDPPKDEVDEHARDIASGYVNYTIFEAESKANPKPNTERARNQSR